MDIEKIVNTVQNQYIHYDNISDKKKARLQGLRKISKEEIFLEKFQQLLDRFYDPHTKVQYRGKNGYILPIYLGILGDKIVVVEDSLQYSDIKKGYLLENIDGIRIEDLIIKYNKFYSKTLVLMKILELISVSKSEAKIVFSFKTTEKNEIEERVRYIRFSEQNFVGEIAYKEPEKYWEFISEKYHITYLKCPPLINENEFFRFIKAIEYGSRDKFILLDIRNNMGGRIDFATRLTELFIEEEKNIFLKSREEIQKIKLIPRNSATRKKQVGILFNSLTCSSLEFIFLNALQGERNILMMGEPTCGMRDVAGIYNLNHKYIMSLSIKKYVDSRGEDLKVSNIAPDRQIVFTIDDMIKNTDRQLEEAVYLLKNSE